MFAVSVFSNGKPHILHSAHLATNICTITDNLMKVNHMGLGAQISLHRFNG